MRVLVLLPARERVRAQSVAPGGELVDGCADRGGMVDPDRAVGEHVAQRAGHRCGRELLLA